MPNNGNQQPPRPPRVSILRQGYYLIASIHTALDDRQLTGFQHDLIERIGQDDSHGIIIDLTVIDVLDSFAARTLRNLAQMALLRGADTVLVGINPGVASTMTEFGINVDITPTALDLDDGIAPSTNWSRLAHPDQLHGAQPDLSSGASITAATPAVGSTSAGSNAPSHRRDPVATRMPLTAGLIRVNPRRSTPNAPPPGPPRTVPPSWTGTPQGQPLGSFRPRRGYPGALP